MPDVIINKEVFYNPVDFVLKKLGGTWKIPVLWRLRKKTWRYTELQKDIAHISQKMLTQTLKELEADGFVLKKVYAEVPPRTEYSLTEKGTKAVEVITYLRNYGLELMKEEGIDYEAMMQEEAKKKKDK
ncbi:HxlR family transcriptional regulator [Lacibacter cauensis]|uniref:HxlR family transcriptional regulator n=1 Tax=Lacibacter cauensis TaxID=510947 RepID=A0A562SW13_9BACT|nr:helix-turn-helix domain-containing protein [Lacibacter cauensis]TWI85248.1 HxlR family transcriptional regulator [Lacibacter cauensis]